MSMSDLEDYQGQVLRVFGPPGTGKTTYLSKRVRSTLAEHGVDSTLIASFSVTAAHEIANRFTGELKPPKNYVGTLHSHAFRVLDHPPVALDPKIISDWNEQVDPELAITPSVRGGGTPHGSEGGGGFVTDPASAVTGDELLGALDRLRAALVPAEDWPPNVREFAGRYDGWKREVGAVDFTDMILEAWLRARDGERPPGGASRLVVDEAQDMTPLEIRLVLSWGQLVDRLVLGLDDDQAINRWRGGDPEPLLALRGDGVADHILDQSYRVPESVRLAAEQWVKRLGSRRHEKLYRPRCDDAGNEVLGAAHHSTRRLGDPALIKEIVTEIDAGRTVMVIAACNYMLAPLIANLRAEGLPFHNPYRPADGAWNPLGRTGDGVTSTAQRIGHYLALNDRDWTGADIVAWLDMIKLADAGMHARAKKVASGFDPRGAVPFEDVAALFVDEQARNRATEPDLDWLAGCLLKDYRTRALYPIQIAKMHGVDALAAKPQCVVGTVHSVKGAAADVVYLCPDVSPAGARSMATRAGVDEAIRQFYVGMTRAYQRLCVLSPSTKRHVRPTELIPSELEVLPQ